MQQCIYQPVYVFTQCMFKQHFCFTWHFLRENCLWSSSKRYCVKIMVIMHLICTYKEKRNNATYFCKASNFAFRAILEIWNFDQKYQAVKSSHSNKLLYFTKNGLNQRMNNVCIEYWVYTYIVLKTAGFEKLVCICML